MKEGCICWLRDMLVWTQPHRAEFWALGRLGLEALATSGGAVSVRTEGAVTCNRLQIAATTDPPRSYRQREYLGSYIAFNMKSAHCILGNDFDQN
jgi:hypothetical protein